MHRRPQMSETLPTNTAQNPAAPTKEIAALLRHLHQLFGALPTKPPSRAAMRVLDAADHALQFEYVYYPSDPGPRHAAYHNIQQALACAFHPRRPPEYVAHDDSDRAYTTEVERLIEIVEHVLAQ